MAHPVIERFLKILFRKNPDSVRETITELIQESPQEGSSSLNIEERTLLSNVLRLRDMSVDDVKIPRADIIAISVDIKFTELIKLISETPFTRLPVYHHTLDDLLGHIHVKDIALHAKNSDFNIRNIIQQVLFVPPSMRLLDLLLQMRSTQIPMAYVVDEYGGVDGCYICVVDGLSCIWRVVCLIARKSSLILRALNSKCWKQAPAALLDFGCVL